MPKVLLSNLLSERSVLPFIPNEHRALVFNRLKMDTAFPNGKRKDALSVDGKKRTGLRESVKMLCQL